MLLVPAYAVVVAAPPGAERGCPTPKQITDALLARMPAVVLSANEASTPGVLRLSVTGGTGATPLSIELTDQGGEARLYRNLTLAERGRSGGDCLALAETVALIVDRFLHDLGYEAPLTLPLPLKPPPTDNLARAPPPPTASRFDLFAGGFWRGASRDDSDFEVGVGLGFERGLGGRRLSATLSGGLSTEQSATTATASQATLRRVPIRFGLFVPFPAGQGQVEPGIRLGVDWLFAGVSAGNDGSAAYSHVLPNPGGELVLAYRIAMARRLFVRFSLSGGVGIPYNFVTSQSTREFREPRIYAKSGLELGFSFQ